MDTKDDIDNPKAPFLEKSNHPGLANDEIYDEERNPSNRRTASRHYLGVRDRHRALMIFHVFLLCLNLILFAMVWVSGSQSYDLRRGAGIIYSPARSAVKYEARTFNTSLYASNKYNGEPRPEQEEAWDQLEYQGGNIVVSAEELRKLNRTSIEVQGQGYLAGLGVYHHIHCLNYVRKYIYKDYYEIGEDPHTVKIHLSHCIDNLRTYIQCEGDISILTYSWRPDYIKPWPDFQVEHECRNFAKIKEWAMAPGRAAELTWDNFPNPIFDKKLSEKKGGIPTSVNDTTELVGGTRLNPKVLALAGGEAY